MSDTVDANNSVQAVAKITVLNGIGDYVENKDIIPILPPDSRVNQQAILPSSVQTRSLGQLFSSEPEGTTLGTGTVLQLAIPSGSSGNFIFYVADSQNRQIVAVPDVAFYINIFNSANQWPNNTFGMGNMPATVFNDWGLTDNFDVATRAIMRNNTGSSQTVVCVCRHRIIANPGGAIGVKINIPSNEGVPGRGGG